MDKRDNLSVVIHKKNDLRVEQSALPEEPGPYGEGQSPENSE